MTTKYDSLFRHYAAEAGLDWFLLKGQVSQESAFNPRAVSPRGAKGLAQFMPATWKEQMGESADPMNPELSIQAQAKYMKWLSNAFGGDVPKVLAAYNWGIGNVKRLVSERSDDWQKYLPRETSEYVSKVTACAKIAMETDRMTQLATAIERARRALTEV